MTDHKQPLRPTPVPPPYAATADSRYIRCENEPTVETLLGKLKDEPVTYPADMLQKRREAFVEQIRKRDPRTPEEKALDEWQADWRATNESNRP